MELTALMRSPKTYLLAITASRICVTSILCYALYVGLSLLSALLLGIALTTDFLDGFIAKKWGIETDLGSCIDVFADFILVTSAFYVLALLELYPLWIELVVVGMFVQFLFSSSMKGKLQYDPVGKHYGTFLFFIILLSAFRFERPFYDITTACIIIVSIITVISRYLSLLMASIHRTAMRS